MDAYRTLRLQRDRYSDDTPPTTPLTPAGTTTTPGTAPPTTTTGTTTSGVATSPTSDLDPADPEAVTHLALQQEVYYNLGRLYQEIKLNHLAVDCYNKVLKIADTHPIWYVV